MIGRLRFAAPVVLAVALVLAWAPSARAHANLQSSDPAAGTTVQAAPSEVVLRFTEQPELALSSVQVLSRTGAEVDRGSLERIAGDKNSLRVGLKQIGQGVYTVSWRTISHVDGHSTAGSFAFGVGVSPAGAKIPKVARSSFPTPLEATGRFLFIAGLIVAFGAAVFALACTEVTEPSVRRYAFAGAAAALAGVLVIAFTQHLAAHASWNALLATSVGRALIRRLVAVGAGLVAAAAALRSAKGRIAFAALAAAAAAAIAAEVTAGHAAASSYRPWAQVLYQIVHFAAAGAWVGGLGALLLSVRGSPSEERTRLVRRYSTVAAFSLVAIGATGTLRALNMIGGWNALFTSSYGRFVIAKTGLFGVLGILGARNRYTNIPRVPRDLGGLRRTARAELLAMGAVLALTAVLTGLSPPPPSIAAGNAVVVDGADLGHTVRVHLEIAPGDAGINSFRAKVDNFGGGRFPATRVSLRFDFRGGQQIGTSTLDLSRVKNEWSATGANLSLDGRWTITAVVQGSTTSAEVSLDVATRCRTAATPGTGNQPTIYSQQLPGGDSDQTYLDPGRPGYNEIHFTFFDAKGNELPIPEMPTITAWHPGSDPLDLSPRRFSPGHFIARGSLGRAAWRFEAVAVPQGRSEPVHACFEQTIR